MNTFVFAERPTAHLYPAGSLGHAIHKTLKTDAKTGKQTFNENAIVTDSLKKPADGLLNPETRKVYTRQELEALPDAKLLTLPPHVARIVSHSRMLQAKRHLLEQTAKFRMELGDGLLRAQNAVADIGQVAKTGENSQNKELQKALADLEALHGHVKEYAEQGKPLSSKAAELSRNINEHLVSFTKNNDAVIAGLIAGKLDAAHAALQHCVGTKTAMLQHNDFAEKARVAAHVSRHGSYRWLVKHISGNMQKTSSMLLGQFGMITMVATTPLMILSFKQMFDAFKQPGSGSQQ